MNTQTHIEHLLYRYASAIDAGDFDTIAVLFADGEVRSSDGNTLASGGAAVSAMYQGIVKIYPDTGTPKTQHLVSNVTVTPDNSGNTASVKANFTVMQQIPDGKIECIIAGEYLSDFQKIEDEWHFKVHRMKTHFSGDLSHHLLISVEEITQKSSNTSNT